MLPLGHLHSTLQTINDNTRCGSFHSEKTRYLQLQHEHHLGGHFVDLVKTNHPLTVCRQLKHGDLVDDLHAAVSPFSPLLHELCGVFLTRTFLHALSDHGKFAPVDKNTIRSIFCITTPHETCIFFIHTMEGCLCCVCSGCKNVPILRYRYHFTSQM